MDHIFISTNESKLFETFISGCIDQNYEIACKAPLSASEPIITKMGKKSSHRYRDVVYPGKSLCFIKKYQPNSSFNLLILGVTAGSMDNLTIQGLSYIKYPVEKVRN